MGHMLSTRAKTLYIDNKYYRFYVLFMNDSLAHIYVRIPKHLRFILSKYVTCHISSIDKKAKVGP